MRRPSVYNQRRQPMSLMMTPMIDVVFLLLVFFIWTASFQIVEQVLPSSLSAAQGTEPLDADSPPPPEADFDDVIVRIIWTGERPTWSVNQQAIATMEQLHSRLKTIADIKSDAPVILHPDDNVPLGDVIDVFDICRKVGFEKVQFAASQ